MLDSKHIRMQKIANKQKGTSAMNETILSLKPVCQYHYTKLANRSINSEYRSKTYTSSEEIYYSAYLLQYKVDCIAPPFSTFLKLPREKNTTSSPAKRKILFLNIVEIKKTDFDLDL